MGGSKARSCLVHYHRPIHVGASRRVSTCFEIRWANCTHTRCYCSKGMVMMVRNPRHRVHSAFHYYKHVDGSWPDNLWRHLALTHSYIGMPKASREKLNLVVKTVQDFIRFPGVAGCQVCQALWLNDKTRSDDYRLGQDANRLSLCWRRRS
jgi:hypothetical protein